MKEKRKNVFKLLDYTYYTLGDKYYKEYKGAEVEEITKELYEIYKYEICKEEDNELFLKAAKPVLLASAIAGASIFAFIIVLNGTFELTDHTSGNTTLFCKWMGGEHIIEHMNDHENNYYVHEKQIEDLIVPLYGYQSQITEPRVDFLPEGFVQINDNECKKEGITTLQILSSELSIEGWENKGYYIPSVSDKAFYATKYKDGKDEYIALDYNEESQASIEYNLKGIIDEEFLYSRIDSSNIELLIDKNYLSVPLGRQLVRK